VATARPLDQSTPLPTPLTPLIGREREAAAVRDLLLDDAVRLVTLTGPGGVGKTRLALQAAVDAQSAFPDSVVFVSLASVRDPDLVLPAIALALRLPEIGERALPEQLATVLRRQKLLLVLDNVEQVIEAAPRITALLSACSGLKALVTSRVTLRLSGEHDYPVMPLSVPQCGSLPALDDLAQNDAVALFVARAQASLPGFALTADNAPAVAGICTRLDGLPLAIELAAAWARALPPEMLLARLGNRLDLLTSGARDQPARLRTMRDAIAWSYDLLQPPEQALFRRLALFAGGFTLEAAEAVANSGAPGSALLVCMLSLLEASLLTLQKGPAGPRYRMLETIREFGLEQLRRSGDEDATRRGLATWCLELAERSSRNIWGPEQRELLALLDAEHDTIRSALSWAVERGDGELAQRLSGELGPFWWFAGHFTEGRSWAERSLQIDASTSDLARAKALGTAGRLASSQGDDRRAIEALTASVALCRKVGNDELTAFTLWRLGMATEDQGDYDLAAERLTEALALYTALDDRLMAAAVRQSLAVVAYERNDALRAASLFAEALQTFRAFDQPWLIGYALAGLGKVARADGEYGHAATLYAESLTLRWERVGDKVSIAGSLRGLASIAALTGDPVRAGRLYGAADALREAIGAPVPQHHDLAETAVRAARAALGEAAFGAAWQAGRALPLAEAVAEALAVATDHSTSPPEREPASATHGLTRREVEVLHLIREGCTNREIGERLFISERTARTHVQNILDKLDVSTRAAAAAYAVEHGIVPRRSPESEGQAVTVAASP
jgi:predicted ATPase/DNA-binding CsgD family transcriptional regulator